MFTAHLLLCKVGGGRARTAVGEASQRWCPGGDVEEGSLARPGGVGGEDARQKDVEAKAAARRDCGSSSTAGGGWRRGGRALGEAGGWATTGGWM